MRQMKEQMALVRAKARNKGISQREFAARIGVSEPTLRSKLYGDTEFTAREVKAIAGILGLTAEDVWSIFLADA